MQEVSVSPAMLEKLRCSICKDYLSCSPIRVSSDGGTVCGCCLPSADEGSTYRNLIFEEMLSKLFFPCKFRKEGCQECLPFGQTKQHEENCYYGTISCPLLPSCSWTGLICNLRYHFTDKHRECIRNEPKFEIQTNQDNQDVFMTTTNGIPFVIKYEFNCSRSKLEINVCCISANVKEMTYRIKLRNNTDPDYLITVKGDTCISYISQSVLNVDQYLENLGNPSGLMVVLLLKVSTKSCRWRGCDQTELDTFCHDKLCQFRLRKCHFCDKSFTLKTAEDHLRQHNCTHLHDQDTEPWSTDRIVFKDKTWFSLISDNNIVYIRSNLVLENWS